MTRRHALLSPTVWLSTLNAVLLLGLLWRIIFSPADTVTAATAARVTLPADSVIRVRMLELVDEHGTVRSRFNAEPGGDVVLRLMDPKGTIRVKLGASADGSALLLLDGNTEPAIHMIARRDVGRGASTRLTLRGPEGAERVILP